MQLEIQGKLLFQISAKKCLVLKGNIKKYNRFTFQRGVNYHVLIDFYD